jgi:RNA polymerase sigma factor (sigma-70 family)
MDSREGELSTEDPARLVRAAVRMASRWCGSRADAEDVAQEAIIRLLRQRRRPLNLASWLFVVTRRLSNRHRLRSLARARAELTFHRGRRCVEDDHDVALDVRVVLSRLCTRDQKLLLSVAEGTSSREIANAFGCHVRDVGQMVSRARKRAKRIRGR